MEKNLHEEGMEEFLRKSFDQYSENPPDDLWDRINTDLAAVPRPALKPLWRFGLSAAAALLLGVIAFQHIYYNRQLDRLEQGIEENTAQLEALEKQLILRPDGDPADQPATGESADVRDRRNTYSLETENTLSGHDRAAVDPGKRNENNTDPVLKKKSEIPALNKTGNPVAPNTPKTILPEAIAEAGTEPVKSGAGPVKIRESLPDRLPGIEPAVAFRAEPYKPATTPVPSPSNNRSKWSAGLHFTASQSVLDVDNDFPFPTHGGHHKAFEDAPTLKGVAYGVGLGVRYAVNKNWALQSGLNYRKSEYTSTHRPFLEFKDREPQGGQGDYEFTYMLKTAGGVAEIELKTSQADPNEMIEEDEPVDVEVTTTTGLEYISVPLTVRYQTGYKRWNFSVGGGFAVNYLTDRSLAITGLNFLNDKFKEAPRERRVFDAPEDCKPLSADYVLSAGVEYRLNEHLSVGLEPTFSGALVKKQLAPFSKAAEYTAGISAGLSYNF